MKRFGNYNSSVLEIYRRTLKRSPALHSFVYDSAQRGLPLIESALGFRTITNDPMWFRVELLTGSYEKATIRVVKKLVKPGMTVLDIGAHVGYYSRRLAALVEPQGRVLAFEPHPLHFGLLKRNMSSYANVDLINKAASDVNGPLVLYDFLAESGGSSLALDDHKMHLQLSELAHKRELAPRVSGSDPIRSFTVEGTTVDDYVEERLAGASIQFAKLDIEGAELRALRGMSKLIEQSIDLALVVELNPRALSMLHDSADRLRDFLISSGFSIQHVRPDGKLESLQSRMYWQELAGQLEERIDRTNIICFKGRLGSD